MELFIHRYDLFRFAFTFEHFWFYIATFLRQNLSHSQAHDASEVRGHVAMSTLLIPLIQIVHVYDRKNDFYGFFLGKYMKYSCGIWRNEKEDTLDVSSSLLCIVINNST